MTAIASATDAGDEVVRQFGDIQLTRSGMVVTPVGSAHIAKVTFDYLGATTPEAPVEDESKGGSVVRKALGAILAVIGILTCFGRGYFLIIGAALFLCGLAVIVLDARKSKKKAPEQEPAAPEDTVRVSNVRTSHYAQGTDGIEFCAWANQWKAEIERAKLERRSRQPVAAAPAARLPYAS